MSFLRNKPQLKYNGITIIMSNPSRFDSKELLTGVAGYFMNNSCLQPETNLPCCDVRLVDDPEPLLEGTIVLFLLGERALQSYCGSDYLLFEQRGSPLRTKTGHIAIASILPQEAIDLQNYEAKFNTSAADYGEEDSNEEEEDAREVKSYGITRRKNFRFWIKQDTKKLLTIWANGGKVPTTVRPTYSIYPDANEIIEVLSTTKNQNFFIDIETDSAYNIRCIGCGFTKDKIYVIPFINHDYTQTYQGRLPYIYRALAIAMRDNRVIAHNGHMFDFFILIWRYGFPLGCDLWDTLIAQQRIYPEVERSLGHCVSLWTMEPFHKDEGNHIYMNHDQAYQLWSYCGKDVFTMMLVYEAQLEFAKTVTGLTESIEQACASIRPYLIASLTGLWYDRVKLEERKSEIERRMFQYLRIAQILTGPETPHLISSQRCIKYFHDLLEYKVQGRTDKGAPSFDKKTILKLRQHYPNPVLTLLLHYKDIKKQFSDMKFIPWKQEENLTLTQQ